MSCENTKLEDTIWCDCFKNNTKFKINICEKCDKNICTNIDCNTEYLDADILRPQGGTWKTIKNGGGKKPETLYLCNECNKNVCYDCIDNDPCDTCNKYYCYDCAGEGFSEGCLMWYNEGVNHIYPALSKQSGHRHGCHNCLDFDDLSKYDDICNYCSEPCISYNSISCDDCKSVICEDCKNGEDVVKLKKGKYYCTYECYYSDSSDNESE